jgi:hypothetical protein
LNSTRHRVSSRICKNGTTRQASVESKSRFPATTFVSSRTMAREFEVLRCGGLCARSGPCHVRFNHQNLSSNLITTISNSIYTSIQNTTMQSSGMARRRRLPIGTRLVQWLVQQKSCPVGLAVGQTERGREQLRITQGRTTRNGAGGGNRTHTALRPPDFESFCVTRIHM